MIGQLEDGPTMICLDGRGDVPDVLQPPRGLYEVPWLPAMIIRLQDPSQISPMAADGVIRARFIDQRNEVLRARILKHAFVAP